MKIVPKGSAPEKRLQKVRNYISKMRGLSTTVTKVVEICSDPKTSPNDLNRVIALDPVLTGKVMMLINSAYYSRPGKISSLTRAIIMLGLNTVKNLALSTSVLESIGATSFQALSMDKFWAHSLCVAVASRTLATLKRVPAREREEYFVAGLLHDLGKIPLNSLFQKKYRRVLDLDEDTRRPLAEAENEILGMDHAFVGGIIAEKWELGSILQDALACHHAPLEAAQGNRQITMVVSLANLLAPEFDYGSEGNRLPANSEMATMMEKVGVREADLVKIEKTVLDEIEKAKVFLQLTRKQ